MPELEVTSTEDLLKELHGRFDASGFVAEWNDGDTVQHLFNPSGRPHTIIGLLEDFRRQLWRSLDQARKRAEMEDDQNDG